MRKFLPFVLCGVAAVSLGLVVPRPASADDPVKPELGAGPHRDRTPATSGEGERPRQPVSPPAVAPKANPGASTGSSASPPSTPDDERSARDREEDERNATEAKDKMKKRPGYKDNVPAPRASII